MNYYVLLIIVILDYGGYGGGNNCDCVSSIGSCSGQVSCNVVTVKKGRLDVDYGCYGAFKLNYPSSTCVDLTGGGGAHDDYAFYQCYYCQLLVASAVLCGSIVRIIL